MKELDFNRMLYAIAVGLYEKEQSTDKYPYSNYLLFGMNMFAALAFKYGQIEVLSDLHEAAFLKRFAAKPVKDWFVGWNDELVKEISKYSLFQTRALINTDEKFNYYITDECADLYNSKESDLFNSLEQNHIYRMMKELDSEQYTTVRRFIVEHPICTEQEIRGFKINHSENEICEIIAEAYEDIPKGSYCCPVCGWTMTFHGIQAFCCNNSCAEKHPLKEQLKALNILEYKRLKHGVMRYMCLPGKLELEIKVQAEKSGCKTELWPEKDRYDIKITFKSGKVWAVDAKTHNNPYMLANSIKEDNMPSTVSADKIFYVIPEERKHEHADYCDICNAAIKANDIMCITDRELYKMIRKETEK